MFFAANLGALGLPDPGFINNLSVEINLFLPIGLFAAFGVDEFRLQLRKYIPAKWTAGFDLALFAVLLAGSVFGAGKLLPILNPVTLLARESDLAAIEWIDDNLPDQEVILINPQGWGYGLYMGADGGYWISPLAGNPTIPPPVLFSLGPIESIAETNTLIEDVMASHTEPADIWDLMSDNDIDYLFIGDRGGVFSGDRLTNSPFFQLIHQNGASQVFRRIE
ncbi:MAG: hypothetical protein GWO10_00420 [candidate division Zixibacteria bacterium]|nr:hypothetical protein [candidate division Zixibacteria bacterium]NIS44513.1 hypothetical protein [candidate division Zixibacteria bacterium]